MLYVAFIFTDTNGKPTTFPVNPSPINFSSKRTNDFKNSLESNFNMVKVFLFVFNPREITFYISFTI